MCSVHTDTLPLLFTIHILLPCRQQTSYILHVYFEPGQFINLPLIRERVHLQNKALLFSSSSKSWKAPLMHHNSKKFRQYLDIDRIKKNFLRCLASLKQIFIQKSVLTNAKKNGGILPVLEESSIKTVFIFMDKLPYRGVLTGSHGKHGAWHNVQNIINILNLCRDFPPAHSQVPGYSFNHLPVRPKLGFQVGTPNPGQVRKLQARFTSVRKVVCTFYIFHQEYFCQHKSICVPTPGPPLNINH